MAVDISNTIFDQRYNDVLNSIVTDLTALKSAHDTLATKLNADAGVTDINYAATAALVTLV